MAVESGSTGAAVCLSLAGVAVLRSLPDEERTYLETRCIYRRIAAGDVLMARFSVGAAVYFMLAGRARVVHQLGAAREITIATVSPGETIGEISAVDGGVLSASIVVDEDCIVAELPKEEFQALLARRGEVALDLLMRWAAIIRDLDDKVSFIASIGPMQRLCSELIRLGRVDRPGGSNWQVPEMPSHQELAIRAQMTREAVAAGIAELVSRGIVERRTRLLRILDFKALKDMVRYGTTLPLPAAVERKG
jgi:CRP-like cAMP-binding protein